jgi:hypothetical protein
MKNYCGKSACVYGIENIKNREKKSWRDKKNTKQIV